jgi:hypothetical protein
MIGRGGDSHIGAGVDSRVDSSARLNLRVEAAYDAAGEAVASRRRGQLS